MPNLSDLVVFHDEHLRRTYRARPIPMAILLEAYVDERVDIPDLDRLLEARREVTTFSITADHVRFLVTRMLPEWLLHTKAQDKRIVRSHYDRGDDFFAAFLGETMIYTSALFHDPEEGLEEAQRNKMNRVCEKLGVRPGHELLDVGCGWGTLALHAAKHFGAKSTGVTLAETGAAFARAKIAAQGLEGQARIECLDYRELPDRTYDRIVSLEMVEHVGIKNLATYFAVIRKHLADDGLFLLQWCGLRRGGDQSAPLVGLRPEDMVWGLFMNKYVFAGADASIPLGDMVRAMEKAGFEIQSTENLSVHYALTIQRWHENWQRSRAVILQTYGERWYRLWHLFLAWSWRIALQGTSACFQVLAHKNLDTFDRRGKVFGHAHARAVDAGLAAE